MTSAKAQNVQRISVLYVVSGEECAAAAQGEQKYVDHPGRVQIERIFAGIGNIEHLTQGRQKQSCTVSVTAVTVRCRLNCICPNNTKNKLFVYTIGLTGTCQLATVLSVQPSSVLGCRVLPH
jgi:hypothetical protein